jgi:hypothetical protein
MVVLIIIPIVMTNNILKPQFLIGVYHDPWEHIYDMSHGLTMSQVCENLSNYIF